MKKIKGIILIIIIYFSFNINILILCNNNNGSVLFLENSDSIIIEITNFENFQMNSDSSEIESVKQNNYINFTNSDSSSINQTYEWYGISLLEYGNCSDFEISVTVEYHYEEYILGELLLLLNSTFNLDGEFPLTTEEKTICYTSVCDLWNEIGGKFKVAAFPNEKIDSYEIDENNATLNRIVHFSISRIDNLLNCSIVSNGDIQLEHLWTSGITKPLNYLQLGYSILPFINDKINVSFYDFYGKFYCTGNPVIPPPSPSSPPLSSTQSEHPFPESPWIWLGAMIGFVLIIILLFSLVFLRHKKNI